MIRVKLLMWNDGEKSLSQLQTSKVRRPPWRPRYCLIWIRRQWSRVNKWSPKFIIMIQTKSSAMAPLVVLLLLCVFCSGGMTDPGAHPITTEQSECMWYPYRFKVFKFNLKVYYFFFRIVLNDWFSSYTRTD